MPFRRLIHALMIALFAGCLSLQAAEPIKALLITGGCCHDYDNQKEIITKGLSQRANIIWDVVHEGGNSTDHQISIYNNPDWAKGYDVIVHNECFSEIPDPEFVKKITQAHMDGVPAVFIHCALHSYRHSGAAELWRELIGVTSKSHERHRPVVVENQESEHPIMKGFPERWNTPNGELYIIEKVWPNCVPLASAQGTDTDKEHIVLWTNTLGDVKVFGTSLGHHNETMNSEEWLGVVSRGLLWTTGKLGEDGKPLPGYEGTGIETIEIAPLEPKPDPNS